MHGCRVVLAWAKILDYVEVDYTYKWCGVLMKIVVMSTD